MPPLQNGEGRTRYLRLEHPPDLDQIRSAAGSPGAAVIFHLESDVRLSDPKKKFGISTITVTRPSTVGSIQRSELLELLSPPRPDDALSTSPLQEAAGVKMAQTSLPEQVLSLATKSVDTHLPQAPKSRVSDDDMVADPVEATGCPKLESKELQNHSAVLPQNVVSNSDPSHDSPSCSHVSHSKPAILHIGSSDFPSRRSPSIGPSHHETVSNIPSSHLTDTLNIRIPIELKSDVYLTSIPQSMSLSPNVAEGVPTPQSEDHDSHEVSHKTNKVIREIEQIPETLVPRSLILENGTPNISPCLPDSQVSGKIPDTCPSSNMESNAFEHSRPNSEFPSFINGSAIMLPVINYGDQKINLEMESSNGIPHGDIKQPMAPEQQHDPILPTASSDMDRAWDNSQRHNGYHQGNCGCDCHHPDRDAQTRRKSVMHFFEEINRRMPQNLTGSEGLLPITDLSLNSSQIHFYRPHHSMWPIGSHPDNHSGFDGDSMNLSEPRKFVDQSEGKVSPLSYSRHSGRQNQIPRDERRHRHNSQYHCTSNAHPQIQPVDQPTVTQPIAPLTECSDAAFLRPGRYIHFNASPIINIDYNGHDQGSRLRRRRPSCNDTYRNRAPKSRRYDRTRHRSSHDRTRSNRTLSSSEEEELYGRVKAKVGRTSVGRRHHRTTKHGRNQSSSSRSSSSDPLLRESSDFSSCSCCRVGLYDKNRRCMRKRQRKYCRKVTSRRRGSVTHSERHGISRHRRTKMRYSPRKTLRKFYIDRIRSFVSDDETDEVRLQRTRRRSRRDERFSPHRRPDTDDRIRKPVSQTTRRDSHACRKFNAASINSTGDAEQIEFVPPKADVQLVVDKSKLPMDKGTRSMDIGNSGRLDHTQESLSGKSTPSQDGSSVQESERKRCRSESRKQRSCVTKRKKVASTKKNETDCSKSQTKETDEIGKSRPPEGRPRESRRDDLTVTDISRGLKPKRSSGTRRTTRSDTGGGDNRSSTSTRVHETDHCSKDQLREQQQPIAFPQISQVVHLHTAPLEINSQAVASQLASPGQPIYSERIVL